MSNSQFYFLLMNLQMILMMVSTGLVAGAIFAVLSLVSGVLSVVSCIKEENAKAPKDKLEKEKV